MRKLTVSQKRILDQQAVKGITGRDMLPREVIGKLEAINNTEIVYQEANRYLWDAYWKREQQNL